MTDQKPSIGRIVHYTNLGDKDGKYPPEIQAALITGVYSDIATGGEEEANKLGAVADSPLVDLTVFYRTGYFQCKKILFSEEPKRGHWNWPPRS